MLHDVAWQESSKNRRIRGRLAQRSYERITTLITPDSRALKRKLDLFL